MSIDQAQPHKTSMECTLEVAEYLSQVAWENIQNPGQTRDARNEKLSDDERVALGKWLKTNLKQLDNADQRLAERVDGFDVKFPDERITLKELNAVSEAGKWPDGKQLNPEDLLQIDRAIKNFDKINACKDGITLALIDDLVSGAKLERGVRGVLATRSDGTITYHDNNGPSFTKSPNGELTFRPDNAGEFVMRPDGTGKMRTWFEGLRDLSTELPMLRKTDGTWVIKNEDGEEMISLKVDQEHRTIKLKTIEGDSVDMNLKGITMTLSQGGVESTVKTDYKTSRLSLEEEGHQVVLDFKQGIGREELANGRKRYELEGGVSVERDKNGSTSISTSSGILIETGPDKAPTLSINGTKIQLELRADGSHFFKSEGLRINVHSDGTINVTDSMGQIVVYQNTALSIHKEPSGKFKTQRINLF